MYNSKLQVYFYRYRLGKVDCRTMCVRVDNLSCADALSGKHINLLIILFCKFDWMNQPLKLARSLDLMHLSM